ncbi:MAG: hypothetical protein GX345_05665 [Clostridiales bacterium]|nr:hypothetical protein [Clostridiales bacterium]
MLGKLIKNEFKSTAYSILNVYLAALVTIAAMAFSYIFDISWISTLSTVLLMILSGVAILMTLVMVVTAFAKSLYGNQGYLSFSLPVKSGALLASKALVAFTWILLSYLMAIAIWIGVYFYAAARIGQDRITTIKALLQMFESLPGEKAIKQMLIFFAVMIFAQIVVLIAQIYFAITLSNTKPFQQYGVLSAIIAFFAVFIVMQIMTGLLTSYVPITLLIEGDGMAISFKESMVDSQNMMALGLTGFFFQVLASATLFASTSYLMNKRVNVK